ncbi:MAG: xanthine dehydrogenase family protein molybdopterin-binding subunit [Sphaerochaeta sp.]|nr:xanthine dehydrogenase family protein molybdopterin-binding subunit [Sphaerochaeta sp.]
MAKMPIETAVRRSDAIAKASGTQKYLSDMTFEGMLYSRMVRSSIPRGIIKNIEVPSLPEGYYFISHKDIPPEGKNELWMIAKDWKCFAENEVRYVGETIGLLVGPDRNVLANLLDDLIITYEEHEPAISIEEGLACKGGAFVNDTNIFCELEIKTGDEMDEVFNRADRVFEETYRTGFQEHVHLETNSVACVQEDDAFVIYASAQCPFYIRKSIAGLLNIPYDKIIVRQTTTGGAFGGKEHFPDVLAGPLLVAVNTIGKPIQMVFDRSEDMEFSVKRHPSRTIIKTALDDKGAILGMDIDVVYNVGGYLSCSFVVLQRGVFHATGCYGIPSTRIHGRGVATNTFPSDAFRGFGAPQTLFAIERHMDHLANFLGRDPLELRNEYLLKKGSLTNTNGHVYEEVKLPEMIKQITDASDYWRKAKEYGRGTGKGIGIALYNHGGAFTGNGEQMIIKGHARLHKHSDGTVDILVGSTEMGQGFQTALRKIAAQVLDLDLHMINYDNPDTSKVPDSGPTAASRSTMIVGKLVERAALLMKKRYDSEEDFHVEVEYEHPEGFPWDQNTFQGDAYLGYGWGAAVVEVEVDALTSEVETKGIWVSHDVGHPIDELLIRGQVNGGVIQSLGYASMEKMENKKGYFKQNSMSDYIIPTSMDFPKMESFLVDNPYEFGPFGAKGMGELVFNGADAAFCEAVSRAIDRRICEIPIPPETIVELEIHGN